MEQGGYYLSGINNWFGSKERLLETAYRLPLQKNGRPYRVVGSRSHMNGLTVAFIDSIRDEYPDLEIVQRGSSLKICMVAAESGKELHYNKEDLLNPYFIVW